MIDQKQKSALVLGAGGFIGSHLVRHLAASGWWVRGADRHLPLFSKSEADDFVQGDLCEQANLRKIIDLPFDAVFQMAAAMGGASYFYSHLHDAEIFHNAFFINSCVLRCCVEQQVKKVFFPSTSYVYPSRWSNRYEELGFPEDADMPASPETAYGWSKLAVEQLYQSFHRNHGLEVRLARMTNVYGPGQPFESVKGKVPGLFFAKILRGEPLTLSGDGEQKRTFFYIDDCIEAICRLMDSDANFPVNIGSSDTVSINQLVALAQQIAGRTSEMKHDFAPVETNSRKLSTDLMHQTLNWSQQVPFDVGLRKTCDWVAGQIGEEQSST